MKKLDRLFNEALLVEFLLYGLGLFLFLKPETTIVTLSYILSGIFLIAGFVLLFNNNFKSLGLTETGLLMIVMGLVFLYKPGALETIIPVLLGIWIIMNGLSRMRIALILRDIRFDKWVIPFVLSLITMFCGMALLINPAPFANVIICFMGCLIIISSLSNIINICIFKKHVRDLSKLLK